MCVTVDLALSPASHSAPPHSPTHSHRPILPLSPISLFQPPPKLLEFAHDTLPLTSALFTDKHELSTFGAVDAQQMRALSDKAGMI